MKEAQVGYMAIPPLFTIPLAIAVAFSSAISSSTNWLPSSFLLSGKAFITDGTAEFRITILLSSDTFFER